MIKKYLFPLVAVILIIIVILVIISNAKKINRVKNLPSLTLSPTTLILSPNQDFLISVIINTEGFKVSAVGAILDYDHTLLEAQDIKPGEIFGLYPTKTIDNNKGVIKISGLAWNPKLGKPSLPFSGKANLAEVRFKVFNINKNTKTKITIYLKGLGDTTDSNIMEATSAKDVLAIVSGSELNLVK